MIDLLTPLLIIISSVIFTYGIYRRYRLWTVGKKEKLFKESWGKRISFLLIDAIFHRRILKDWYPGVMHLLIFIGFIIPLAVVVLVNIYFTTTIAFGNVFSLFLDVVGTCGVVGIGIALYRRYITRPERLDQGTPDDAYALILIGSILLLGFCIEGLRIAITQPTELLWSPVGFLFSKLFTLIALENSRLLVLHKYIWEVHLLLVLAFFAYAPYSKLLHIVTSPLKVLFQATERPTTLKKIADFETAETFGASTIEEFSWLQLFELDACTRCGRCQDNCPAHLSEKPLSPKKVYLSLKAHLESKYLNSSAKKGEENIPTLIGDVVKDDTIWACTTCLSCYANCPVFISYIDKNTELRRYLVLMESRFPTEVQAVLKNMENNSNPWGIGRHTRADWAKGLDIKTLAEDSEVDVLFWPGCAGAFDDRSKKVTLSMVRILKAAGVKFGILGVEEGCCGDSARRIGNEYLYDTLVQGNLEVLERYKVKKIVATCPHCYNTLKNDYLQYGVHYQVLHHTEFIAELIQQGKLAFNGGDGKAVCYHDSCYLGRYNNVYKSPREVLQSIPGTKLLEMERARHRSFCCGAGGGRMWMEEHLGKRINEMRVEQALEVNPEVIASACPYCLTMLEDGIKAKGKEELIKTLDVAEIIEKSLRSV